MDARFWILVVPVWLVALVAVLISLLPLPRAPWARTQGWRMMRTAASTMVTLIAMVSTLNVLTLERRSVFGLSPVASSIATYVLIGLLLLAAASVILLGMLLSWARTPEAAKALHVSPHLYTWLFNRDINEGSQSASSAQPLPGDEK